jgi:hypothetical protein
MSRRRTSTDGVSFNPMTQRMAAICHEIAGRLVYASMPRLGADEWMEMIADPADLKLLQEAAKRTDQFYQREQVEWWQPFDGKDKVRFTLDLQGTGMVFPNKRLHFDPEKHPEVAEKLSALYSAALDFSVVKRVINEFMLRRDGNNAPTCVVSTLPQLTKAWPRLAEMCMPSLNTDQQSALTEAMRGNRLARVTVSEGFQKAMSFVEFHIARCSLLDDDGFGQPWPRQRIKLRINEDKNNGVYTKDAFRMKLGLYHPSDENNNKERVAIVFPQYPYS